MGSAGATAAAGAAAIQQQGQELQHLGSGCAVLRSGMPQRVCTAGLLARPNQKPRRCSSRQADPVSGPKAVSLWSIVLTAAATCAGPPLVSCACLRPEHVMCLYAVLTATATCIGLLHVSCSSFTFRIKREPEMLNVAGMPEFLYG
jgi:hypothetical protein